ncbi:hypothetical protein HS7_19340 [Sulfolobales archaeon HS-7]|nr:hypothetical protein HS7_19340 [Sulfolobales archaeon HS-7]
MPILSSDEISKYVGQKVKDIYGREFGLIVNVYTEIDGTVTGIEAIVGKDVVTLEPSMLRAEDEKVYVLPEWKADAIRIMTLMEKTRRRQRALEELYGKGDISKGMYDEMKRKLDTEALKLKDDYVKLKNKLKSKINEIDDQLLHIEKALAMLKMNYISNEVPETSYKLSVDALRQSRDAYSLEKDDIRKTLDKMESIDKDSLDVKPIASASEKKEEAQFQMPIPVKVTPS